jgi:asparagine synthase (glutamine-hydrolysing)
LGPKAIELPLQKRAQRSISFPESGHHVLRGDKLPSFAALRCGSLKQRFSQIDMLSLDVWWRGQNVIVDGGTYLFNGSDKWHRHFVRTQSHNTVQVDGLDQMVHYRRFKNLYWTEAKLLGFENNDSWVLCEGEHYGFQRRIGCVHRRAVLFVKDDLWVVLDWLGGEGDHDVRLHWLAGDFPHQYLAPQGKLILRTPRGPFCLAVMDQSAVPVAGEVVVGRNDPPRGWMSRYYGERVPVPSLQVRSRVTLPSLLVTVLTSGEAVASAASGQWRIQAAEAEVTFTVNQGRFANIGVARAQRLARASI